MAHSVRLTDYTVDTITLSSAPYRLLDYNMSAPRTEFSSSNGLASDTDVINPTYVDVQDTITIMIDNATAALAKQDYERIELFVERVNQRHREDAGPKVYIEVQMQFDSVFWSSEILTMVLKPSEDSFIEIPQGKITFDIIVLRRYYWQNNAETLLTGSNGNGSATLLTIKNHDDATSGDDNYASYTASNISGTIKAPIRVTLQNTSGSAVTFKNVHIAVNGIADPTNFQHIWDSGAVSGGIGTNVSDSNSSGGSYRDLSFGVAGDYTSILYWLPSSNFFSITRGRMFRALAACRTALSSNAFLSIGAGVFDSPLFINTWRGDEVQGGTGGLIYDLGNIRLPQSNFVTGTTYSSGFSLNLRCTGATAFQFDFLMLVPASGYRKIEQPSTSIPTPNNEYLIDDSLNNETVYRNASNNKLPIYVASGNELSLWPGVTNRVYVLVDEPSFVATRTMKLQVEYWARRLTF
jgi:hypothetical protein